MNKIVFFILLLSFFSPLQAQIKKTVKKPTASKIGSKSVSQNKRIIPISGKKSIAKKTLVVNNIDKVTVNKSKKTTKLRSDCVKYTVSKKIKTVLVKAKAYEGVPYALGGATRKGIDCSALVKIAFEKANIELPRRSIEMGNKGKSIKISKVKEGDLLFFATSGGSKVNHVGIVYTVKHGGIISFIHASSSGGVMISDLEGNYWPGKFVKAKRIT